MRDFARLPGSDRAALFAEAAALSGLPLLIIEKDFWVCWMLERLWTAPFASHLIFKGGTSLSKCFDLVQRFSEDIDIGLDRAFLGFEGDHDPTVAGLSRSQRNRRVESLKAAAKNCIETTVLDDLTAAIRIELGEEAATGWNWQTEYDGDGMPKLRWNPPLSKKKGGRNAALPDSYLNRGVLIEIGSRAAHWPAKFHTVSPYVAQHIPLAFAAPSVEVCTLEAQRTFWEKATILHVLNQETKTDLAAGKPTREREHFSRHCYDLHCIARSEAGKSSARDFALLDDVVHFKRTFFCSSLLKEEQYAEARPGTFQLAPHPALDKYLADDYAKMRKSGMFFGAAPSWDEIRQTLQETEKLINER